MNYGWNLWLRIEGLVERNEEWNAEEYEVTSRTEQWTERIPKGNLLGGSI